MYHVASVEPVQCVSRMTHSFLPPQTRNLLDLLCLREGRRLSEEPKQSRLLVHRELAECVAGRESDPSGLERILNRGAAPRWAEKPGHLWLRQTERVGQFLCLPPRIHPQQRAARQPPLIG